MSWLDALIKDLSEESEEFRIAYQEEVERYEKVDRARQVLLSKLVHRRKSLKMSQKELAELTNVSQAYISQIERDRTSLSASFLIQMLDALDLEYDLRPRAEAKVESGVESAAAAEKRVRYRVQKS